MNKIPSQVINVLKDNQEFLLVAHLKPDGDAIGSTIALGKGLKHLEKNVSYYIDVPIEDKLSFFNEIKYFNQDIKQHYDVLIYLDCSTPEYAFKPKDIMADTVMVIDHHRSNESFAMVNLVEETSATGELVFRILKEFDIPLDYEMIDAIYTSISTDTGSFQFSNVTSDTHVILSQLYQLKDNFTELSKKLHSIKTYQQMKLLGKAINSLVLLKEAPIAWVVLTKNDIEACGGAINITDDIANIGVNLREAKMAVTIKEKEQGVYRISLRSKTPFAIDVSIFAKQYNGGGHYRAAGFTYSGDLEELKSEILDFFQEQGE